MHKKTAVSLASLIFSAAIFGQAALAADVEIDDPDMLVGTWSASYPAVQFVSMQSGLTAPIQVTYNVDIITLCSHTETDDLGDYVTEWYVGTAYDAGGTIIDSIVTARADPYFGSVDFTMEFARTEMISGREYVVDYYLPHEIWDTKAGYAGKLQGNATTNDRRRGERMVIGGVTMTRMTSTIKTTFTEKQELCDLTQDRFVFNYPYGRG